MTKKCKEFLATDENTKPQQNKKQTNNEESVVHGEPDENKNNVLSGLTTNNDDKWLSQCRGKDKKKPATINQLEQTGKHDRNN